MKQQFEERLQTIESKVLDVGLQVVTQTYQALVSEDTPLATKADQMGLQHQINNINGQLSQIIGLLKNSSDKQDIRESPIGPCFPTPPCTRKRPNQTRIPEKSENDDDTYFTQEAFETSAASNLDIGMEGCED
jgi:hypothetical protein